MSKDSIVSLTLSLLLSNSILAHNDRASHEHSSITEAFYQEHEHQHAAAVSTIQMAVNVDQPLEKGKEVLTTITLMSKKDGKLLSPAELKEVHTEKVHLLIFDQTLNDYQHIPPIPSSKAGEYTFIWTPQREGFYRVWADLVPLSSDQQEYVVADIPAKAKDTYPVEKTLSLKAIDNNLTYTLSFDKSSLKVGDALLGKVTITDKDGKPFQGLEPVIGTFAHIMAISEDFQTIEHVHPMGAENPKPTERGAPKMQFHLSPSKAGFLKIYVQVQIQGKQHFIPFGIQVSP